MSKPPLKLLHANSVLSQTKMVRFSCLTNEELVASLQPGQAASLKTRPDGTVIDGHHRVRVLMERGYDVDTLPREVVAKEDV